MQFDFDTQQLVLQKIAGIEAFSSRWQVEQQQEKGALKELRFLATVQSAGSSTRIEGATLNDNEIRLLVKNMKITELRSRDEQEVGGYYEVLETILGHFADIPLTESYLLQLHGMLLRHSAKDQRHRGQYKSLSNQVVASSPGGAQRVVFNTTQPHRTPSEMTALLEWANRSLDEKKLHPLLVIATFVYEFLSIHPFQDGNGRLSRLLTTLLLLRHGYDFVQYVSFENYVEEHKEHYYLALMDGQQNRYQPEENIAKWVLFFLSGLEALIGRLEEKRRQFRPLTRFLHERQQRLLQAIGERQAVQISDLKPLFPEISLSTLKNDLALLTERQLVVRVGSGRGVRYFIPPSEE